jgi:poly(A) polymerase
MDDVGRLKEAIKDSDIFSKNTYLVGGYVRDFVLGIPSDDIDILVDIPRGALMLSFFLHSSGLLQTEPLQLSKSYPIWQIMFKDSMNVIQLCDPMKETFPDETTRQRVVNPGTMYDDIKRRDFGVNMLAQRVSDGEFIDIAGTALDDIKNGVLRGFPGVDMSIPFSEDPLRMIRLIRFHCKFGWRIPLSVVRAVKINSDRIKIVSKERIQVELNKIIKTGKLWKAVEFFRITGLLKYIFPYIYDMIGVSQRTGHQEDCYEHTILVLKALKSNDSILQLAGLFHDIGKPVVREWNEEKQKFTFYGHEDVSADLARVELERLRYPEFIIDQVVKLVKYHMRVHVVLHAGLKGIRKFIREFNDKALMWTLVDLGVADAIGRVPTKANMEETYYKELREKLETVNYSPIPVTRTPVLNGHEIMDLLNIGPGKHLKEMQQFLFDIEDEMWVNGKVLYKDVAGIELLNKYGAIYENVECSA